MTLDMRPQLWPQMWPQSWLCCCVTLGRSQFALGASVSPLYKEPDLHLLGHVVGPACSSEGNHNGLCYPLSQPTPVPSPVPIRCGLSWHGT